jgi:predicted permease
VLMPQPEEPSGLRSLAQFHQELLGRVGSLPQVSHAGGINALPMSGNGANGTFIEVRGGKTPETSQELIRQFDALSPEERTRDADYRAASAGYFAAMGIPLVRGRLFQEDDGPDTPHVAVVSQSFVRRYWPGEEAIGKRIQFGNMDGDLHLLNIVGVVGDVRGDGLDRDPRPIVYTNYFQRPAATSEFSIVARSRGDIAGLTAAMRRETRALNPEVPTKFQTVAQIVSGSFDNRRFSMIMLSVFAGAALLLAMTGLYGIMAFMASERTKEIGVRMALGAQRGDVLRMILRQGLAIVLIGIAAGLIGAFGATRLLVNLLYGTAATDLTTYGAVIALLIGAALLATYFPARRAARIDPIVALRAE